CARDRQPAEGQSPTPGVVIDPGDEPERLIAALGSLAVDVKAILITHCHFDHIGAVAPLAAATGAPVYCPSIEQPVLADIMRWVPPGFGPFDSYDADHTLAGGEGFELAGLNIVVRFTPGHSPGHITYAISPVAPRHVGGSPDATSVAPGAALFSGDVLFAGSVGRVDLPGGDWATLERSIGDLLGEFAPDTTVYPGHMGVTTLGRERDTNPFLAELRSPVRVAPEVGAQPQRR
ncbi:MAG TPA: MBL fold metallo-hydrolase, partial [Solirubrobacteraceae bacterium]|nr:MBL fold metallo-hydrolase [Solirubrobacteraceae bacterium]